MLAVAGDAIKYLNIFDEEAKELLLQCVKFLKPKFSDVKSIFKFSAANKEHRDIMGELFALMDNMDLVQCDNCSHNPHPLQGWTGGDGGRCHVYLGVLPLQLDSLESLVVSHPDEASSLSAVWNSPVVQKTDS